MCFLRSTPRSQKYTGSSYRWFWQIIWLLLRNDWAVVQSYEGKTGQHWHCYQSPTCFSCADCEPTNMPITFQLNFRNIPVRGQVHSPDSFTWRVGVGKLLHSPLGMVLQLEGVVAGLMDRALEWGPVDIIGEDKTFHWIKLLIGWPNFWSVDLLILLLCWSTFLFIDPAFHLLLLICGSSLWPVDLAFDLWI